LSQFPAPTIFILEDDADSRALYCRALESEDYDVTTEANGKTAMEKLAAGYRPRLILLDLSMPEMDGADFFAKLKALPDTENVKVVLVSGWADIAKRAQALGADGYIRKPVELRTFSREVKKHLL
jgi:CheY-like chemotaxis protein